MTHDEQLRVLKRYYPAVRNLRKDVSHNIIPMQLYKGMMGTLIRTYQSLHTSITDAIDDPYLEALKLDIPDDANDKMAAAQISLLVGQLLAYIEGTMEYLKLEEQPRSDNGEKRSVKNFDKFLDEMNEDE